MSQNDRILNALKEGDRLTPMDALIQFHCMRLSARINDLRKMGHRISTRMKRTPTKKWVAEYCLEEL